MVQPIIELSDRNYEPVVSQTLEDLAFLLEYSCMEIVSMPDDGAPRPTISNEISDVLQRPVAQFRQQGYQGVARADRYYVSFCCVEYGTQ